MRAVEDTTYQIRIETPGRTFTDTLSTVGGRRLQLQHWTPRDELILIEMELVGSLDADPVVYRATAVFNLESK